MRSIKQTLPGTFSANISSKQMSAIDLAISLGKKMQTDFREIGNLYKEGCTLSMLVSKFNVTSYLNVNLKVAEGAVYRALKGYDGHLRNVDIEPYDGLLSEKELNLHGKEHNKVSGAEVGKKMFEQKKGIFAFTKDQQEEVIRKSILACGNIAYSKEELVFIEKLASDPQYQKRNSVKVTEVTLMVNRKFHEGKEVRKPRSISKTLFKIRNAKP